MRLRVKNKWQDKNKERTVEDTAGVVAFNLWKIASANVLNLENEGFQTDTQRQRLDIIAELCAFLVHVTDRWLAEKMTQEQRQRLVTAYALKLADFMQDNRADAEARGQDYRAPFIEQLNARMADYAEFSFDGDRPGYALKRYLGEKVTETVGPNNRKWVSDQVMEIEAPEGGGTRVVLVLPAEEGA